MWLGHFFDLKSYLRALLKEIMLVYSLNTASKPLTTEPDAKAFRLNLVLDGELLKHHLSPLVQW